MATKEHLALSTRIKKVHKQLRKRTRKFGATNAWKEHLNNKDQLNSYSKAMKELATNFWDTNLKVNDMNHEHRIEWSVKYCLEYFQDIKIRNHNRERERRIYELLPESVKVELPSLTEMDYKPIIRLLDVGSCYNPFKKYDNFDVTAIDISPACPDVLRCDFLNAPILHEDEELEANSDNAFHIVSSSYDVVVFSLLLEYLPTSEQRITCCEKAYEILGSEGILIVIVPDSKHVGANAKLAKNWRYTLALMGFSRIKYEKLVHITCMVFRKAFFKEVAVRWANIHKEEYMTNNLFIPQDFNDFEDDSSDSDS